MSTQWQRFLETEGIRFLRVVWCDNANVIRAKAVHAGSVSGVLEYGVGISKAQQGVYVARDAFVPESGLGPVGEVRLVPDVDTFTALPFAAGHARVLGDMMVDGKPWALCPRDFVRRMTARANALDLEVQAAFENEFYLLKTQALEPADRTLFCQVHSMNQNARFLDELTEALLAQRIPVAQYYPESGFGQHELSVGYAPALEAADRQVAYRETVHAVAHHCGLRASFLPKIFPDQAGSGCHLHLSLWRNLKNLVPDPSRRYWLSDVARAFMAGLLDHLPALMAVTTPIPNSYRRLLPHCWSGAYGCWGLDNREAALRVPSNPAGPGPTNMELKTVDAASNPYLAVGAVMAAGLDGVARGLELRDPVAVDPGLLTAADRSLRGVERLPETLEVALARFEADTVLQEAMGPELARAFLAVRRKELEVLGGMELQDEVELLLERY